MRSEGNPLDLNNLPEDYSRDGKLTSEDTSSSAAAVYRKKKSGGKDDSSNSKVYECRFCSLKFCKSQALGGHMNRHRQERETETLNKARQLVFTNDHLPPPHLGYVSSGQTMGDPSLPFRPLYPTRLFPTSSPLIPPPTSYMYTSPSRVLPYPAPPPPPVNDYFMGHVLSNEGNYTCIGAPVGHGFPNGGGGGVNEEEGIMKWGRR